MVGSILDILDGALARAGGKTTPFGSFLDSTTDRVGEGAMLGAIALVFARHGNEVALARAFAGVAGSFLVSYTRAKAEALGLRGDVGIGSRAERVVVITAGLVLAPWGWLPWVDLPPDGDGLADGPAADPVRAQAMLERAEMRLAMLIFIIGLIVWGFIVGGLARLSLPGPDPMPWYATIGLGLGGSLIGGILARLLIGTAGGLIFAFLGAVLLLYLYRRFVQGRGITGPDAAPRCPSRLIAFLLSSSA